MILVIAGTQDGRQIAANLNKAGFPVIASVITDYGSELVSTNVATVLTAALDAEGMAELIKQRNIKIVIDASHPYAVGASNNAMQACTSTGVKYVRYERPKVDLPQYSKLYEADSYEQAARAVADLGQTIFLTIGSRMLRFFAEEPKLRNHKLVARILPDLESLAECAKLGFRPQNIIALQGPFSHELNVALFKEYRADVVVTKNSGSIGGSDTKISAAVELDLPIVVVSRPSIKYNSVFYSIDDVIKYVGRFFNDLGSYSAWTR